MGPSPPSLLLVDDDLFALELQALVAREAFPEAGIDLVSDPLAVAERCAARAYDCLVLDYDMPKLNGLTLARRLRRDHPHLPIVLCTGAGDEMLAAKALQNGVTDYIPKSAIKAPALRRTIMQAIRISRDTRLIADQRTELETFAFALAHDFKQPLRQIITFSDLARGEIQAGDLTEVDSHLAFLGSAARRLSALVDAMSHYTLLNKPVELEPVEVEAVLDGVLQAVAGHVRERGGEVRVEGGGRVLGNAVFLHQLLQNLIVNGLHYNRSDRPLVTVRTDVADGAVTLRVRDNGIGIGPEFLEQVFRPLARLHTNAEYAGTGLGLTMARKAATMQGGTITCASELGVGSEFTVRLPAPTATMAA